MNKRLVLVVLLLAASLITGCMGKGKDKTSVDITPYSKSDMKLGYDGQEYFSPYERVITETEDGYYYFDYSYRYSKNLDSLVYLMFFDKKIQKSVPVCNLADCTHEKGNEECNAQFLNQIEKEESTELPRALWYYDGNLYTVLISTKDGSNTYNYDLYQISPDGSKRTKYTELYTLYSENGISLPEAFFHRGYVYYRITDTDGFQSLYKVKVEKGAEPELLTKLDDENKIISKFQIYKTGITYLQFSYTDESSDYSIKYYDESTGKITTLLDGEDIVMYTFVDDRIYYVFHNKVYLYDLESKEKTAIFEADDYLYISYDGKYLYAEVQTFSLKDYSKHYIYVLDLEGNLIDTIQAPSSQNCYFGNEDYLFQMFDLNENLKGSSDMPLVKVFDKSQIGTGNHEWIELPIMN